MKYADIGTNLFKRQTIMHPGAQSGKRGAVTHLAYPTVLLNETILTYRAG